MAKAAKSASKASAKVLRMDGSEVGSIDLDPSVFSVESNETLVHEVVVALMNARRQGNASTKTRAEVRGGGRKPFRQKGTGMARQGSIRQPQMPGGGIVFGPRKRSYIQAVPVRAKRKALCCVLSDRVRTDALCVLESLTCSVPKTRLFLVMTNALSPEGKKTLFITADVDKNVMLSARNIPHVSVRTADDLNALDVLNAARVVVVQDALRKLEGRLAAARQSAQAPEEQRT